MNLKKKDLVHGCLTLKLKYQIAKLVEFGKQTKLPFNLTTWRANEKLKLIRTDLAGPQRTLSLKRSKYYIVFIDDYTRIRWIYFIRFKLEVFSIFWIFKTLIKIKVASRFNL